MTSPAGTTVGSPSPTSTANCCQPTPGASPAAAPSCFRSPSRPPYVEMGDSVFGSDSSATPTLDEAFFLPFPFGDYSPICHARPTVRGDGVRDWQAHVAESRCSPMTAPQPNRPRFGGAGLRALPMEIAHGSGWPNILSAVGLMPLMVRAGLSGVSYREDAYAHAGPLGLRSWLHITTSCWTEAERCSIGRRP